MGESSQETKPGPEEAPDGGAAPSDPVHGLGVKAVSCVDGREFTDQERRDIINDAPRDTFAATAKTPIREYGPEDDVPFTD